MTLDGTRTYIIGRERAVVIDPGPELEQHLDAVADAVGSGIVVSVLLTHAHPDHAEGAVALATRLAAPVRSGADHTLSDDIVIMTDEGPIRALATPGHTPDHFSFWWDAEQAVFCGDLMMGGMDTALVAQPEGDLAAYLASLRKLAALDARIIYPAHGEPFDDPQTAIDRYIAHREERIVQVVEGLRPGPLTMEDLLAEVYGPALDPRLRHYAETALEAYLVYLRVQNRVQVSAAGAWSLT